MVFQLRFLKVSISRQLNSLSSAYSADLRIPLYFPTLIGRAAEKDEERNKKRK